VLRKRRPGGHDANKFRIGDIPFGLLLSAPGTAPGTAPGSVVRRNFWTIYDVRIGVRATHNRLVPGSSPGGPSCFARCGLRKMTRSRASPSPASIPSGAISSRRYRHRRRDALKMLLAGRHAPPAERERFFREAEAVAGMRRPNVVQAYEASDVDGQS
jgi:hypothetical protein